MTSARATGFGRYSSLRIASSTRWRVAARTCGLSLITRDTVWSDTPASFATSAITTARGLGVLFASELIDSVTSSQHPPTCADASAHSKAVKSRTPA